MESKIESKPMSIDSIVSQISSLKDNSESFITGNGDDEIWVNDVRACESAIAILSALQDAGIGGLEELQSFLAEKNETSEWCGSVCAKCGESTSEWYDFEFCPHCGRKMVNYNEE